jgi:hypothetical protein
MEQQPATQTPALGFLAPGVQRMLGDWGEKMLRTVEIQTSVIEQQGQEIKALEAAVANRMRRTSEIAALESDCQAMVNYAEALRRDLPAVAYDDDPELGRIQEQRLDHLIATAQRLLAASRKDAEAQAGTGV